MTEMRTKSQSSKKMKTFFIISALAICVVAVCAELNAFQEDGVDAFIAVEAVALAIFPCLIPVAVLLLLRKITGHFMIPVACVSAGVLLLMLAAYAYFVSVGSPADSVANSAQMHIVIFPGLMLIVSVLATAVSVVLSLGFYRPRAEIRGGD